MRSPLRQVGIGEGRSSPSFGAGRQRRPDLRRGGGSGFLHVRAAEGGQLGPVSGLGPWPLRAGCGAQPACFGHRARQPHGCSDPWVLLATYDFSEACPLRRDSPCPSHGTGAAWP
eukprot:2617036-Alexandrium_andersonii.AAC.1